MTKARDLAALLGGGTSGVATFGGTAAIRVPNGTTAQRPTASEGMVRYNSTLGRNEVYDSIGWTPIAAPPVLTAVSPDAYNGESGTSFTLSGSNFEASAVVKIITSSGAEFSPASTSVNSTSSIVVTTPQDFTVANGPLTIKVTNPTGLSSQLDGAITTGTSPTFNVSAGLAGTYVGGASVSLTLDATDVDAGSTVTYSLVSGSLPSGLSLNTSTGVVSGTAGSPGNSEVTSSFTIRATDNAGNYVERAYSIKVQPQIALPAAYQSIVTNAGNTVYYVNATSGSDNNNGTSRATAFGTIPKAVSVAGNDGVIVLSPEVHYLTGNAYNLGNYGVASFTPSNATRRMNLRIIGYPGKTYIVHYNPGSANRDFHFALGSDNCAVIGCILERDLNGGSEGMSSNYMTAIFGMNEDNFGAYSSTTRLKIQNCVIKNCGSSPTKRPGGTSGYDKFSWVYDNNNNSYAGIYSSLVYGGGSIDWMSSYSGANVEANYVLSNISMGTSGVSFTGSSSNVSIDTSFWGRSGQSQSVADSGGQGVYSGTYSWQNATYNFAVNFYGSNWS